MAVSKSSNNLSTLSNSALLARAATVIPGGVNSPVRAFGGVGGTPLFISHGAGPYVYSQSGQQYIDYIGSWGPLILGHADSDVSLAVKQAVDKSLGFGAPTLLEIELAEKIISLMPNIEKIRMVNSGTEATMTAIRLARGYTKKDKIIKFIGCYHGHSDSLLVRAGSGLLTHSVQNNTASSAGVPVAVVQDTLLADFNDLKSVADLFAAYKDNIAAIIVEPIPGNMNMILPKPEFLHGLRELCTQHNSVLIFDEVMSGFRVDLGGAQALYNVKPDLTTLGKVIGGGLPVGAFGGLAKIMECLSPIGDVYQAGTLSGNPIAMTAGLATLNKISSSPDFFKDLSVKTHYLITELSKLMARYNVPFHAHSVGGMFGLFFLTSDQTGKTLDNFDTVTKCDLSFFKQFFHAMLDVGVYLAPSAFEAGFVSAAHSMEVINKTINAVEQALKTILKVTQ